ncbi:hypothetical protein D6856_10970, partial [Butyrivibrio sp. XB500-5]|uniref:hypothetical protein n=1 Tax=Butyrivibrio sp. XB500-5 TaxID=2364880 RepID=UPI000ED3CAFF
VGTLIFELNYDNQAKEILEGQRRYREQMNSQYTAGYTDAEEKYEPELAQKESKISELCDENTELRDENAELKRKIAELEKAQRS